MFDMLKPNDYSHYVRFRKGTEWRILLNTIHKFEYIKHVLITDVQQRI